MQANQGWSMFRSITFFCMPGNEVDGATALDACLVVCCLVATACNSVLWLRRLFPCCHTHTFVFGLGCYSSHLHYNLLLLWAALVEYLAVSHPFLHLMGTMSASALMQSDCVRRLVSIHRFMQLARVTVQCEVWMHVCQGCD